MKSMMFEPLPDTDFSIHPMNDLELEAPGNDVENFFSQIRDIHVNFATIDLGNYTLREFENTPLAINLKKLGIPYFAIELPYYVKDHFAKQIKELKDTYFEVKATYDLLEDKNKQTAQELNHLLNYYSKELREIHNYINLEVRTKLILEKILRLMTTIDKNDLTFVHFGERSFFMGIFSQISAIKGQNQFLNEK